MAELSSTRVYGQLKVFDDMEINGNLTVNGNKKIPFIWDPSTNTPTLQDGTGTTNDTYICIDDGQVDLGSGEIQYYVGDFVIYDGQVWTRKSKVTVGTYEPDGTITTTFYIKIQE